eukprot:GHVU01161208.1.p1 GENE.GHVU01161208.1~~GHVU01161208.1.p1  ORF type:complete len:147 (-),score=10.73 GHVU01161208.1:1022-1462(-)
MRVRQEQTKEAGKQIDMQAGRHAGRQARRQAWRQAGGRAGTQAGSPAGTQGRFQGGTQARREAGTYAHTQASKETDREATRGDRQPATSKVLANLIMKTVGSAPKKCVSVFVGPLVADDTISWPRGVTVRTGHRTSANGSVVRIIY